MALSLHTVSVGTFLQVLPAVAGLVDKAAAHCRAQGLDDAALTGARIAPDMWDFAKQVAMVAHHSEGTVRALLGAGELGPDMNPAPEGFTALRSRITDAIAYLEALDPAAVEARQGSDMTFVIGERRMPFTAEDYVLTFALPNFYFHATAAYAILRGAGLAVGKMDFMGRPRMKG